jgi:hypothetical protein
MFVKGCTGICSSVGNAFVVRMLNRYRRDLGVTGVVVRTRGDRKGHDRQLQEDTATVSIARSDLAAGKLTVDVDVKNLAGHKFPTGYPARRTWLHLRYAMEMVARCLIPVPLPTAGLIRGNDNDADPLKYEPHYDEITSPDQVQIYEPILGDASNMPTTGLLFATHYLKDNRLLPRGFDKTTADKDIGVYGGAMQDSNFTGDGDRIRYVVEVRQEEVLTEWTSS